MRRMILIVIDGQKVDLSEDAIWVNVCSKQRRYLIQSQQTECLNKIIDNGSGITKVLNSRAYQFILWLVDDDMVLG